MREAANTQVTTADTTTRAEVIVVATRDIAEGEELTFDYQCGLRALGAHRERRLALQQQYRCWCRCNVCIDES